MTTETDNRLDRIKRQIKAADRTFKFEDGDPPTGYDAQTYYADHSFLLDLVEDIKGDLETVSSTKDVTSGPLRSAVEAYLNSQLTGVRS